ncbi:hypothetical protein KC926_01700 [Candidatus Kaiserbacteria bacterium]|nr:hypothetical protein [Candidatus Kaiserbacteria bacterium]
MKTIELNLSNLSAAQMTSEVRVTASMMPEPWFLDHCFNCEDDSFEPKNLANLLRQYCQLALPELQDPVKRIIAELSKSPPNGMFGTEGLSDLSAVFLNEQHGQVKVGLTGACLEMRRYGSGLGIRCKDSRNDEHALTNNLFTLLAKEHLVSLRQFHHRIEVSLKCSNEALDVDELLAALAKWVPSIQCDLENTSQIVDGVIAKFLNEHQKDVLVGRFHGALPVYLDFDFDIQGEHVRDANVRRGIFKEREGSIIRFYNNGTHPELRVRFYVRTGQSYGVFNAVEHGYDYAKEQRLMLTAVWCLAVGLGDFTYFKALELNSHWLQVRNEP